VLIGCILWPSYFRNMPAFSFPQQTSFYSGKVRDVYSIAGKLLVMIASDRISAFDVILPRPIPGKGQVLNQVAAYMLEATRDICPNWLLDCPAPNVSIGMKCEPIKIEMVVRGYLAGHAWRTYSSGKRVLCGAEMPDGLSENDPFPSPIITPSTKADEGHDEDISPAEIIEKGLCSASEWEVLSGFALKLFSRGQEMSAARGLILADTKYEFGMLNGAVTLMDEIHTPDSSRYFYSEGFEERQKNKQKQKQLSKEFVREWLIENDFMGKPGQKVPVMTDEWIATIRKRYIELYETLTGKDFIEETLSPKETEEKILHSLEKLLHR
jgi:phosphoribosylaminoimidazole-succinocarboxamide synthase